MDTIEITASDIQPGDHYEGSEVESVIVTADGNVLLSIVGGDTHELIPNAQVTIHRSAKEESDESAGSTGSAGSSGAESDGQKGTA